MRGLPAFIAFASFFSLFIAAFLFWVASERREDAKFKYQEANRERRELERLQTKERETLDKCRKELQLDRENFEEEKEAQEKAFEEKTKGFPWVAEIYAIYRTSKYEDAVDALIYKSRPAIKSAVMVRELKQRTKEAEKKYFFTLGLLKYYENLFPSLTDYQEAPDEVTQKVDSTALREPKDPARAFLSCEEWDKLSSTEKCQRALDKYCKRKKSNWEIGREFERYIGYKYEADGWDVDYFGAKKGLEDLGRDLIAKKDHKIHVVQCKYWAKGKTIHEKHIFQLYGTSIVYAIENNLKTPPLPVFVSSCQVSEIAQKAADRLGVCVCTDRAMPDYPCIKCNVGRDGEKIYHLPFDQQYDKIRIEPEKGEF